MHIPATGSALLSALAESTTAPEPARPIPAPPDVSDLDYTVPAPAFVFDDLPAAPVDGAAAREARMRAIIREQIARVRQERADRELLTRLLRLARPIPRADIGHRPLTDYRGWW